MRYFRLYLSENWHLSTRFWEAANLNFAAIGAIIALVVSALIARGWEFVWSDFSLRLLTALPGSFLLTMIFVVTPYRMWVSTAKSVEDLEAGLADATKVGAAVNRLPFVEFALKAVPELLASSEESGFLLWDLRLAVQQAAIDEILELDGKMVPTTDHDSGLHTKPLRKIEKSVWDAVQLGCEPWAVLDNDNTQVWAYPLVQVGQRYRDLHFRSASAALDWLRNEWPNKRGVTYPDYLRREAQKRDCGKNQEA